MTTSSCLRFANANKQIDQLFQTKESKNEKVGNCFGVKFDLLSFQKMNDWCNLMMLIRGNRKLGIWFTPKATLLTIRAETVVYVNGISQFASILCMVINIIIGGYLYSKVHEYKNFMINSMSQMQHIANSVSNENFTKATTDPILLTYVYLFSIFVQILMGLFFGHLFQFANFITFDIFVICYYGADLLVLYYEIRLFTKWQRNTRRWSCSSLASDHGVDGDDWMLKEKTIGDDFLCFFLGTQDKIKPTAKPRKTRSPKKTKF